MNISEHSRVWIYQSDRELYAKEQEQIQQILNNFTAQWQAHGHQLAAHAEIRYNRFIIISVDEQVAGATGCSIDKSVKLMQGIEKEFSINLFDRFQIAYRDEESIKTCNRREFEEMIERAEITADSIVFNNLIATRAELNSKWETAVKDSWHAKVFEFNQA